MDTATFLRYLDDAIGEQGDIMDPDQFGLGQRQEITIMRYSGRAMYGVRCVALNCQRGAATYSVIARAAILATEQTTFSADEGEEFIDALTDHREDSMGLGFVVYWPHMRWSDDLVVVLEHAEGPRDQSKKTDKDDEDSEGGDE